MIKVKRGDLEQLGVLYERYKRVLFSFFYNLNNERELSEDLVQNVFIRILKYKHAFKGEGEFKTWMFHIARNVHADNYRQKIKYPRIDLNERDEAKKAEWPLHTEEQDLEEKLLERALYCLENDKKEILLLSKFQNKKYKEIGQILNCSEGAVKVKVFRAVQALKEKYFELAATLN